MSHVVLDEVDKTFGTARTEVVHALRSVSLDIEEGDFAVLLGPSGSGKTTALRCIAGLEKPDGGAITCGDRVFVDCWTGAWTPTEARHISMVFQSYALWPHMTVGANIEFGLKRLKVPSADRQRRTQEVLSLVGLGGYEQRAINELSGGQMQRVALARALAVKPGVVLMDEPLSNLDPAIRIELRDEIKRLHQEDGTTTIYVTHDQSEALALADKIAVFRRGAVEQFAEKEVVRTRPATPFVADFLGWNNMLVCTAVDGTIRMAEGDSDAPALGPARALAGVHGARLLDTHDRFRLALHPDAVQLLNGRPSVAGGHASVRGRVTLVSQFAGKEVEGQVELGGRGVLHFRGPMDAAVKPAVGDDVAVHVDLSMAALYPVDDVARG